MADSIQNSDHPAKHSWLFSWLLAVAAGYGAWQLYQYGQRGDGVSMLGAIVLGLLTLRFFFRGLGAWEYRADVRHLDRLRQTPTTAHGQARWGTARDAKRAGMFIARRLLIGRLNGRMLHYPGEAHLMTIAPAGAGKGTSIVVPNLLNYRGSMVVTDPKGELTAMTARHRRKRLRNRIIVLNPWREKLTAELGRDLGDAGFNPLAGLRPGPDLKDEAELIASLMVPGQPGMSEAEDYFVDFGQTILAGFMLYMVSHSNGKPITLPELRKLLMSPAPRLSSLLSEMASSSAFGGLLAEYGGRLGTTLINSPKEFSGGLSTAQKSVRIYDGFGPLGAHVSDGHFDFASIKEHPTTVYIIMPSDRAGTHAAWLNLVISLAIEMVGRDRTNKRVVFLLDEFANLGYLPNVLRGMAQYRGQGVQIWTIIQQISMLRRLYKDGWQEFVGLSELINTFGVWEPETLRLLSDWIGQETIRDLSFSSRPEAALEGRRDVSFGQADRGRPLIRPEAIRTLPTNQQLVFYRNLQPFMAEKMSYLEHSCWRRQADANPYYRRK